MSNISHNVLYLRQLLKNLSTVEFRRLVKYLSLNDDFSKRTKGENGSNTRGKSQYVTFIGLVMQYQGDENVRDLELFIGKKYSLNQRRSISSRLIKRIDDFLLMELTLSKGIAEEDRIVQQFLLRRIVILDVLLSRGLFTHFEYTSNKLIVLADRYERYLEGASIIRMQMSYLVNRVKSDEYARLVAEHDIRITKYQSVLLCNNFSVRIQQMYNEKFKVQNILQFLHNAIDILNKSTIDSDTWRISRNLIFLEYCQQIGDYKQGDEYCNETISIYLTNKFISNFARLSNAYRQLANNQLLDSRFSASIDSINNAIIGYSIPSLNWVACKEHLFLSYFHLKKFEIAKSHLEDVLKVGKLKSNLKLISRINYYNGILFFINLNYTSSIKSFYDSGNLHDDKGGWGFGFRLYTIMAYIELNDINSVLIIFDSFRKYYSKYSLKGEISSRFKIIFQILKVIINCDFDWNIINPKVTELILKLNEPENKWEIKSPELLNFESWIDQYLRNGKNNL